jgi:hypothetical protein
MWLALAAITVAAAIEFNVLALAIRYERWSVIGFQGRPCNSREAPHVDNRRRECVLSMDYHR